MRNEINLLNPRKAPGIDRVTPTMLKEITKKRTSRVNIHLQRYTTTQILAEAAKTSRDNNDTQAGQKPD